MHTGGGEAMKVHGRRWQRFYLAKQTLINMLRLAGHMVARILRWPSDASFRPSRTTERGIELFFSGIKAHYRGMPNLKDAGCTNMRKHWL